MRRDTATVARFSEDGGMPQHPAHTRSSRSSLLRLKWPLVATCSALCLFVPHAAWGTPSVNTVPNPGAQPVAAAPLQSGTTTTTTPPAGPLGIQILNESAAVEALGEQVKAARLDADTAHNLTITAQQTWLAADANARDLRSRADSAAAEAYKKALSLGPFGEYADAMHQLGVLAPGLVEDAPGGVAGSQTATQDATRAEALAQQAYSDYQLALTTEQRATQTRDQLTTSYDTRSAALATLMANNTQAVADAEAAQEAEYQRLAAKYGFGSNSDGMAPNPIARKAVKFAISQLKAKYVFGAEGPYDVGYDCSGLVWAAYRAAGVTWLPRIAKDQFHATTQITDVSKLVAGDLVFFSRTSKTDWTTISHVGIYLGNSEMIEAPHTGDVVKIASIDTTRFFGATRVVPAVPPPPPTPTPTHSHTSPSPSPSVSGPASPPKSPSPTPSTTPSPTPSPTPSKTPSPSPSDSPSTEPQPASPSVQASSGGNAGPGAENSPSGAAPPPTSAG